ncbi:MAG TPA: L-dopachrome tautomerase-related protein [Stellaceae bacterium]|nr:L-dopachrome tautomerase-related protein [Stellaceae bacterium]
MQANAAELVRVAASPEAMINGVAVSPQGRVFASFPRWADGPTPCVAEAMADGTFRPFPGGAWNAWRPGEPTQDRFVAVHSVFADRDSHLWVIDDSAPHHQALDGARPKIVRIDLGRDAVSRVYALDEIAAPPGAILGHMRVAGRHAFVTESHHGAIIVLDLDSGAARRRLGRAPQTRADPTIVPVIDGKEFRRWDGGVQRVNVNLIELSNDRKWLYFTALFGPMLRRVETRLLLDPALDDDAIVPQIEDIVPIPPCAGIAVDARDNLYLSSFTENAIAVIGADRVRRIVAQDPRISFPNEGCVGPDGHLYVPASQIHRIALFQTDRVARVQKPWELLKLELPRT